MNKHRSFSLQSHSFEKAIKPYDSKHDLDIKRTKNEILKGLNRNFPKDAHQKSEGESVRFDLEKLDSFTLETSKNHLIHNFCATGAWGLKAIIYDDLILKHFEATILFFEDNISLYYIILDHYLRKCYQEKNDARFG